MAGIDGTRPVTPGVTEFVKNAQQVGAQRQGVTKPEGEREETTTQDVVDQTVLSKGDGETTEQKKDPVNDKAAVDGSPDGPPGLPSGPPPPPKATPGSKVPLFMSSIPDSMMQGVPPKTGGQTPGGATPGAVPPGFPGVGLPPAPGGPGGAPGPVAPPSGNASDGTSQSTAANMAQMAQTDSLQANQVFWQMYAERQKAMWKIFQLIQDLQTSIYAMIADSAAKRAKTMDSIAQKWAQVLGA